jgi:hypothetical protein
MGQPNTFTFPKPTNDKKSSPPLSLFKKAQGLMIFDFLRPKDQIRLEEFAVGVNGVSAFF